jgi:hypothetical protein
MNSHEKYLELCAASTAGELSRGEEQELQQHLAVCASCRRVKHDYEMTVANAVPALADDLASPALEPDDDWSVERAESAFFKRLRTDQNSPPAIASGRANSEPAGRRFTYRPSQIPWAELWMPFAAFVLLAIALAVVAYRSGVNRGAGSAQQLIARSIAPTDSVEGQLSELGEERAGLLTKLADDGRRIQAFRIELAKQTQEIRRLKSSAGVARRNDNNVGRAVVAASSQISNTDAQIVLAQKNLVELQAKVDSLAQERYEWAKRAESLEAQIYELTRLATDRDQTVDQQSVEIARQQELLDHDRDIRELMGARDLYIAEIHDVAGTGEADKTYGRVFYTKGKSLIFYAYDLDQESGLKTVSTFQAWGCRSADKQQALNLGVFYQDNASKKRWVLKFDDPKTLANIDAVFVTVEPQGPSHHPSGKPLLFAYLRVNPNHP